MTSRAYRGRVAPTPTGFLHLGHASTFAMAMKRSIAHNGTLIFRNEDLDPHRCKQEYIDASISDLKDAGIVWQEGPDVGGKFGPYNQSERLIWFTDVWRKLLETGLIYPCYKSRKEINAQAKVTSENEVLFPKDFRPTEKYYLNIKEPGNCNWRFRVPKELKIEFNDNNFGHKHFTTDVDFSDFLIWRKDGFPSYELAVVADDYAMQITEVVRGADLLLSTARQILLYNALDWYIPDFFHCELILDESGQRLAKTHKSLALREIFHSKQWLDYKKSLFN
ncbi:MAG: glutamate--tRNA ligase family protein [Lentisphaeraceae bacterium]|nr:glutamate--tRNA ligase family protein [Lentisphaeraceae bacterium]